MNKRNTIITGVIFLFLGYFVLSSKSSGIAAANGLDATGSPTSFITCANCHSGGSFNTTATVQILDGVTPVSSYVPGNTYTMTLQVSGTASYYGGQAVALTSSNSNAGIMGVPTTTETQVTNISGKSFLEQSTRSSSGIFSVPWTAPSSGTGNVSIYFIGNGVDGSYSTSGDEPTAGMFLLLTEAPAETCSDGIMNQDETGIDCGGTTCAVCETCSDGIMNQDETGIDCGGTTCAVCETCSDGIMNQDETGIDCGGTTCAVCETCSDGIMNQDETGIDCGGTTCAVCETCFDGIMNQDETDIDCGGIICIACPTCFDSIQNGDETGIDCGGSCNACIPSLYVDHTATGANDGSSWLNAFTDLNDALAQGAGMTLFIAEGTYKPTIGTNRALSFTIPDAATLQGGYPNGGGNRDIEANPTILSGDIDNDPTYTNNSYHVVKVKNVNNVVIDGLTIREGNANIPNLFSRARGGGLFATGSTLTLIDTRVLWNKAVYGGGLFATLSPDVSVVNSTFKQNEAEYGSALYHSNTTNMYIRSSRITNNNSNFRCAIEINNSLYTLIENSVIANNNATNANAIAFIATNRNQTCDIYNSTIIGGDKDKSLISLQIGNNDELGVNFYNSIIAHQDLNFIKSFIAFNNNILNLHTENCYIQGASVIGTGINNIFSDTAGDLMLNADYSVSECSPVIDAGNDLNTNGLTADINDENRFFSTVDIGAFEAQTSCSASREMTDANTSGNINFSIYPNPTSDLILIKTELKEIDILIYNTQGELMMNTKEKEIKLDYFPKGIYLINIIQNRKVVGFKKVVKL